MYNHICNKVRNHGMYPVLFVFSTIKQMEMIHRGETVFSGEDQTVYLCVSNTEGERGEENIYGIGDGNSKYNKSTSFPENNIHTDIYKVHVIQRK